MENQQFVDMLINTDAALYGTIHEVIGSDVDEDIRTDWIEEAILPYRNLGLALVHALGLQEEYAKFWGLPLETITRRAEDSFHKLTAEEESETS